MDVNGCNDIDCFPGVECTDNPAPLTGATCGDCPNGTIATINSSNSCQGVNPTYKELPHGLPNE